MATAFVPAHPSRWCVPGDRRDRSCRGLANPRPINRVVIHVIQVPGRGRQSGVQVLLDRWQLPGDRNTAPHYVVDRDGTVTQLVREADVAFHARGHNRDSIGIEHADLCHDPTPLTNVLYQRSAALTRDIMRRHGIRVQRGVTLFGHSELVPQQHHDDPGPFWDWDYYVALIRSAGIPQLTPVRLVVTADGIQRQPGWARVDPPRQRRIDLCARPGTDAWSRIYWQRQGQRGEPATYTFTLFRLSGQFRVSLWWTRSPNPNRAVPVEITSTGQPQRTLVNVDQSRNAGRWNDVGGPVDLRDGGSITVRIGVDQPATDTTTIADAVRVLGPGA